jgi:hypothetical protein
MSKRDIIDIEDDDVRLLARRALPLLPRPDLRVWICAQGGEPEASHKRHRKYCLLFTLTPAIPFTTFVRAPWIQRHI